MELDKPFKQDKNGLWYVDFKDINTQVIHFPEIGKCNAKKATFYKVEGMDNIIIKDTTEYPYFLNRHKHLKLLSELVKRQSRITDVDYPFAYCKDYGILRGIVELFYLDSISINDIIYSIKYKNNLSQLEVIKNYYNHENDNIDNIIVLLLNILELISKMHNNGVYYTDIRAGNFLLYNNEVKVIDFEPDYVRFKDRNGMYLDKILFNYASLVETILRRCGFEDVFFNAGEDFYETEKRVLSLRKSLER